MIDPYDTEQFAEAMRYGLEMKPEVRRSRMERMMRQVHENNVYRQAANFLGELGAARAYETGKADDRIASHVRAQGLGLGKRDVACSTRVVVRLVELSVQRRDIYLRAG